MKLFSGLPCHAQAFSKIMLFVVPAREASCTSVKHSASDQVPGLV